jgi:hypothetical protein
MVATGPLYLRYEQTRRFAVPTIAMFLSWVVVASIASVTDSISWWLLAAASVVTVVWVAISTRVFACLAKSQACERAARR